MSTLCNLCGKNEATIHFKGLVNHQTLKMHLCETCAKKKGMSFPFGKALSSVEDMVSALVDGVPLLGNSQAGALCPTCGMTFTEFQQTSMLGCSQCYSIFAPILGPLLQRIHGSAQHMGKSYSRTVRALSTQQELTRLKLELNEAIKKENFEQAAMLRDEVLKLERQMTAPPSGTPRE